MIHFEEDERRPKGHCTICWQSWKKGSGFDHIPCQTWMWDKAVEETVYLMPEIRDVTVEIDNWLDIQSLRQYEVSSGLFNS